MAVVATNMIGHIQTQLTRSLERILEDAQASGELKLSGRKLKDFPNSGSKYNLTDTVIADLSKNRLSELPSEITTFLFLERLVLYHNTIRSISDSVITLQSLTYLDLSRNQLTTLPKEICQLPLQILLISSNRLTCLPDELGRMSDLTELDVSCNQITHLPHHLSDLTQLRSLILRCNRLLCLSVEITNLQLERLDIRENRIASLPVELRYMQSLIDLQLEDNPLTSPPAYLCKRGRVHIFKYLELEAAQRNRSRGAGGTDVKRSSSRRSTGSTGSNQIKNMQLQEGLRHKRHNVDSGYSTSDGFDKRWSQEMQGGTEEMVRKSWANRDTSPLTICTTETSSTQSGISTPSTISPGDRGSTDGGLDNAGLSDLSDKYDRFVPILENGIDHQTSSRIPTTDNLVNGNNVDDKIRQPLTHIQTYREYKEALRQQRNQDAPSVYRSKQLKTEPNTPTHQMKHGGLATSKSDPTPLHSALSGPPKQIFDDTSMHPVKKIVSRNNSFSPTRVSLDNGNDGEYNVSPKYMNKQSPYVKPPSPVKNSSGALSHDHVPSPGKIKITSPKSVVNGSSNGSVKNSTAIKSPRTLTWNKDIPPEKLSFTMRREFDKAREESDLIEQLRSILETRLKMALPDDLAPALTDGVVLCHLANHVKPRSVASIHVPSPAVPKLTMARCRKNVDNFLEACRRIGVEENLVCCAADVLEGRGLVQVAITVTELLRFHKSPLHHGFNGTTPHPTVI